MPKENTRFFFQNFCLLEYLHDNTTDWIQHDKKGRENTDKNNNNFVKEIYSLLQKP